MTLSLKTFTTRQRDDFILAQVIASIDHKLVTHDYKVSFNSVRSDAILTLSMRLPKLSHYVEACLLRAYRKEGWRIVNMTQTRNILEIKFKIHSQMLPKDKR